MGLLELIGKESLGAVRKLAGMAMLSGLANAGVLAIINAAATHGASPIQRFRFLLLFAVVFASYILAQHYILVQSTILVENTLNQIRLRLVEKVRSADLLPLETIGRSSIYSSISKELVSISQATMTIVAACQASLLVLFSLLYLAILSKLAFAITLLITFAGVSVHFRRRRELQRGMRDSVRRETAFLDLFTQMLDGFKELKLNRKLGDSLTRQVREGSDALAEINIATSREFSSHAIFSQAAFYVMMACIVFLLPKFDQSSAAVLTKATATILFIVGPLTALIGSIPVMAQANVAVANVHDLEAKLASATELRAEPGKEVVERQRFSDIRLDRLRFDYFDPSGEPVFTVGPLNLEIRAGQTIFIIGGNGSGKSTFLRLLSSLYFPRSGRILLDGNPVTERNLEEYRSLFSVIFADYHLFDQLYGQEAPEPAVLAEFLRRFELKGKVDLDGLRWSTTALSTGQRKRLALIVSWLENRPIQIFDEWAADQDPGFRKYFYEVLLPEMKQQGKTVIAATHDDRYFHLADRVLRMEFGQFEQEEERSDS
jgi:putative ATP-binding cassette transporter